MAKIKPKTTLKDSARLQRAFEIIEGAESNMSEAILQTIEHIAGTHSDKYVNGAIETKTLIYHDSDFGKGYNVGCGVKYLQRYLTKGFEKSENPADLKKSLHYVFFELARVIKHKK